LINIAPAEDLLSIALKNVLSYRDDEEYYELIHDWNKTIIIDVERFYPVAVKFEGDTISFNMDIPKKYDLKITMDINTMMDIAYGRSSPLMKVLTRKIKIKGILKVGTILKFMKIFLKSMKMVADDPNDKYYEINKDTR